MKVTQIVLAAGILAAASTAQAGTTVYDFSGYADGTSLTGIDLGGLTLDGGIVNGGVVSSSVQVNGVFSMFGVINVALDISGNAFLNAYDLANNMINNASGNGGTLSVAAPGAYSISFGSDAAYTFDNLTVDFIGIGGSGGFGPGEAAIPVPAALPLMATALAGVVYLGVRRRK